MCSEALNPGPVHLDSASSELEQRRTVRFVREAMAAIARGELTYRLPAEAPAEVRDAVNAAIGSLQEALTVIAGAANAIEIGCRDLSGAADQANIRALGASLGEVRTQEDTGRTFASLAAASHNLAFDAEALNRLVRGFKVLDEAPPETPGPTGEGPAVPEEESLYWLQSAVVRAANKLIP